MAKGEVAADKKGARREGATLVFVDESGFSERPSVRRSWAPKGQTPVVELPFNWKRLSAIGAISTDPDGQQARLFLSLRTGNVDSEISINFLRNLRRHIRGKIVLLWDRLPAHRSKRVEAFVDEHCHWLQMEFLPPYAPELNPVEGIWAYLGATDLANYSADGLDDLASTVHRGKRRLRRKHNSGRCYLKHSGLFPNLSL